MHTTLLNRRSPARRRLLAVAAASLAAGPALVSVGGASASRVAMAVAYWPFTATVTSGPDAGQTVHLRHLANLTLEDLGAKVVGQATLHVNVASSPYRCLDGTRVNVFAFEGQRFLHNGLQGSQCTYGTWEIAPATLQGIGQAPVITAAHLAAGTPPSASSSLVLSGRSFGTSPGSVVLIGDGAGSSGPVVGVKVTSWAPTRVQATTGGSPTATVALGGRTAGPTARAARTVASSPSYYVLLLTSGGAAASALTTEAAVTTGRTHVLGIPPGTKVTLTAGSRLATIGSRSVHLGAAPEVHGHVLLAPVGFLAYLVGARSRWEQSTRELRLATARAEVIFRLGSPRYSVDGTVETGGAAPAVVDRVLLVPVAPVAEAFGLSLGVRAGLRTATGGASSFVITPCEECGGSGGSGGNSGSGGSGGGQPVAKTISTVYGFKAQPLVGGMPTNTWCNVPDAPSYLGGFPLGSCTAGAQSDSLDDPGAGVASIGTTVFGVAGGEVDQPMELAYVSRAPAGVPSTISVTAIVDTVDLTFGLSGVGGSCAPSQVNATAMQPGTDTLSTCLNTFQSVIPAGDVGSATSSVLGYANTLWSGLSTAQQACIDTPQAGVQGAACAMDAANVLMSTQGSGLSVTLHQSPPFTFSGPGTGGATSYFSVDPEAQVSDVGLGTELNFMTSWVVFVVTEQYTESQYAWTFPVAEVGQPLMSNWLEQCASSSPLSCQLVEGSSASVTSGDLPTGMSLQSVGGDIVLAGSPAAGTEGAYQFTVQVAGGSLYYCTIDVGPPLALGEQGSASSFTYETRVGFANDKAFPLPFTTTGGVGGVTWSLVGNPRWLGIAYSPPTGTSPGSPPVLYASGQAPTSGSYPFQIEASDDYGSLLSQPLHVVVVPETSFTGELTQSIERGTPYRVDLSPFRSGGATPFSFQVDPCNACGSLPPGIGLDRTSGVLSGVPSADGTYDFVVAVTDALGATSTMGVSVTVSSALPLTIQPSSLPGGTLDSAYSFTLEQAGTGSPPFAWAVTGGKLPPGLALAADLAAPWYGAKATISGTPSQSGSFSFSLRLSDKTGESTTRSFTITVAKPPCPPKVCSPPPVKA
ncbi:MAG: putative Ig domain-containing protein [Actinomycetota bacterium]|nr:putative Ig domain-containing protein [Actinomycetota bacterium]